MCCNINVNDDGLVAAENDPLVMRHVGRLLFCQPDWTTGAQVCGRAVVWGACEGVSGRDEWTEEGRPDCTDMVAPSQPINGLRRTRGKKSVVASFPLSACPS